MPCLANAEAALKPGYEAGRWWHTRLIPALGRQGQANLCEFKASLVYRVSNRTRSKATEKPCLKTTTKKKKERERETLGFE